MDRGAGKYEGTLLRGGRYVPLRTRIVVSPRLLLLWDEGAKRGGASVGRYLRRHGDARKAEEGCSRD